jgi:hypothetical protein
MSVIVNPTTGGGGGPINSVTAILDFGFSSGLQGDTARTTVSAVWVTNGMIINVQPYPITTSDHDPDDYALEDLIGVAQNIVPGVGFDIFAYAPNGTWGQYWFSAVEGT